MCLKIDLVNIEDFDIFGLGLYTPLFWSWKKQRFGFTHGKVGLLSIGVPRSVCKIEMQCYVLTIFPNLSFIQSLMSEDA